MCYCRDPIRFINICHQRATRLESFSLVFHRPLVGIYKSSVPVLIYSLSKAGFRQVSLTDESPVGDAGERLNSSIKIRS